MQITLRDDLPAPNATLLIHMGAGSVATVIDNAIAHYVDYEGVREEAAGLFCVSVYAAMGEVDIEAITTAMPHPQFGACTVERVREHFVLLPTSIEDPMIPEPIAALQHVHFDVELPLAPESSVDARRAAHDVKVLQALREQLQVPTAQLMALFEPRQRKGSRG